MSVTEVFIQYFSGDKIILTIQYPSSSYPLAFLLSCQRAGERKAERMTPRAGGTHRMDQRNCRN